MSPHESLVVSLSCMYPISFSELLECLLVFESLVISLSLMSLQRSHESPVVYLSPIVSISLFESHESLVVSLSLMCPPHESLVVPLSCRSLQFSLSLMS